MSKRNLLVGIFLICVVPISGFSQILKVTELSVRDLQKLDRTNTVVIIPVVIFEQQVPYLPSFTD